MPHAPPKNSLIYINFPPFDGTSRHNSDPNSVVFAGKGDHNAVRATVVSITVVSITVVSITVVSITVVSITVVSITVVSIK
jgi:hypothetical protein